MKPPFERIFADGTLFHPHGRVKKHVQDQELKGNIRVFCRVRPQHTDTLTPLQMTEDWFGDGFKLVDLEALAFGIYIYIYIYPRANERMSPEKKGTMLKGNFILQPCIFMGYVGFQGDSG